MKGFYSLMRVRSAPAWSKAGSAPAWLWEKAATSAAAHLDHGHAVGGGKERITVGEKLPDRSQRRHRHFLEDDCIVEAGCYVTAGARILLQDGRVVKARELSGERGLLFRRNSQSGALEATRRATNWNGLNAQLHG